MVVVCWMHLIFCFAVLKLENTWPISWQVIFFLYLSKFHHFFFRTEKKMNSKFSVAKLCSDSSCTFSASIGFIIFKFKRRIRTNKNIVILSRGLTSWSSRSHCFQMHLTLNLMQGNMWKKDCIDYCMKKVNWFR